jgi:hypothetical protein
MGGPDVRHRRLPSGLSDSGFITLSFTVISLFTLKGSKTLLPTAGYNNAA